MQYTQLRSNLSDTVQFNLSDGDVIGLALIGRTLASIYTDVLHEPLPEHLRAVARRLERVRAARDAGSGSER